MDALPVSLQDGHLAPVRADKFNCPHCGTEGVAITLVADVHRHDNTDPPLFEVSRYRSAFTCPVDGALFFGLVKP